MCQYLRYVPYVQFLSTILSKFHKSTQCFNNVITLPTFRHIFDYFYLFLWLFECNSRFRIFMSKDSCLTQKKKWHILFRKQVQSKRRGGSKFSSTRFFPPIRETRNKDPTSPIEASVPVEFMAKKWCTAEEIYKQVAWRIRSNCLKGRTSK